MILAAVADSGDPKANKDTAEATRQQTLEASVRVVAVVGERMDLGYTFVD